MNDCDCFLKGKLETIFEGEPEDRPVKLRNIPIAIGKWCPKCGRLYTIVNGTVMKVQVPELAKKAEDSLPNFNCGASR